MKKDVFEYSNFCCVNESHKKNWIQFAFHNPYIIVGNAARQQFHMYMLSYTVGSLVSRNWNLFTYREQNKKKYPIRDLARWIVALERIVKEHFMISVQVAVMLWYRFRHPLIVYFKFLTIAFSEWKNWKIIYMPVVPVCSFIMRVFSYAMMWCGRLQKQICLIINHMLGPGPFTYSEIVCKLVKSTL